MAKTATVAALPDCDFCKHPSTATAPEDRQPAEYDFKTKMGPWAFACPKHWEQFRAFGHLGTGIGQKLEVKP